MSLRVNGRLQKKTRGRTFLSLLWLHFLEEFDSVKEHIVAELPLHFFPRIRSEFVLQRDSLFQSSFAVNFDLVFEVGSVDSDGGASIRHLELGILRFSKAGFVVGDHLAMNVVGGEVG
jgi:hypothetical protein